MRNQPSRLINRRRETPRAQTPTIARSRVPVSSFLPGLIPTLPPAPVRLGMAVDRPRTHGRESHCEQQEPLASCNESIKGKGRLRAVPIQSSSTRKYPRTRSCEGSPDQADQGPRGVGSIRCRCRCTRRRREKRPEFVHIRHPPPPDTPRYAHHGHPNYRVVPVRVLHQEHLGGIRTANPRERGLASCVSRRCRRHAGLAATDSRSDVDLVVAAAVYRTSSIPMAFRAAPPSHNEAGAAAFVSQIETSPKGGPTLCFVDDFRVLTVNP